MSLPLEKLDQPSSLSYNILGVQQTFYYPAMHRYWILTRLFTHQDRFSTFTLQELRQDLSDRLSLVLVKMDLTSKRGNLNKPLLIFRNFMCLEQNSI